MKFSGFNNSSSSSSGGGDPFVKIPLKSLETIKQNLMANGQIVITPATNNNSSNTQSTSNNQSNNSNSISVTSTNPKTPSPSTNEVSILFNLRKIL